MVEYTADCAVVRTPRCCATSSFRVEYTADYAVVINRSSRAWPTSSVEYTAICAVVRTSYRNGLYEAEVEYTADCAVVRTGPAALPSKAPVEYTVVRAVVRTAMGGGSHHLAGRVHRCLGGGENYFRRWSRARISLVHRHVDGGEKDGETGGFWSRVHR